jgi:uncharacterized iron-regulated membrane protein
MKPLQRLDFLAPAPRPWAGLTLLALGAAALAWVAIWTWSLQQAVNQHNASLRQQATRQAAPSNTLGEAERVRMAQASAVLSELRAPWDQLLSTFEERSRNDIGLLKLEPDAKSGLVRVTGQAKDTKALFAYLKELESDQRLISVALNNHQLERDAPGRPVRFMLQARWRTATGPTRSAP